MLKPPGNAEKLQEDICMISNQLIVDTLVRIKKETGVKIRVLTPDDMALSADGAVAEDLYSALMKALPDDRNPGRYEGFYYFRVKDHARSVFLLECASDDKSFTVGKLAALQLETLLTMNEERFDMDHFFKNLLLDNLLIVDIYSRANALHINTKTPRVAFLIELSGKADGDAVEVVRSLMDDSQNNFVTAINENDIVLVKEMHESDTKEDLAKLALTLYDMLNSELMDKVLVAYGNPAREIREVANSYKEAKLALSVGKVFNPERHVTSYDSLGIGRLIYQLPLPMCKMFIDEIFAEENPADFDEETIMTVNEFFANSLNVSETARRLYIHRNTLVYRLDKIQKLTGLDLRVFDDAITFKMAMMVTKYMHYMGEQK